MAPPTTAERFDQLHAAHRDAIAGYLRRLTRNEALAEDLTQEAFLRAGRGLAGFRGESSPSTWIYHIATNVYLDHHRRRAARGRKAEAGALPLEDLPDSLIPSTPAPLLPDRLFEQSEMGSCVREFVDSLPPESRAMIVLHDLQGLTNAEIARVFDCSLENVKIRVHRARQKLKALLSEHCDFDRDGDDVLRCDRKQPPGD
ncbi:MAG: RNA polymerase sigma factor [Deltaproteobacteria bacterium]|nr:RNA polymerase sigma factor [Deltaproteobacteria bacterium]